MASFETVTQEFTDVCSQMQSTVDETAQRVGEEVAKGAVKDSSFLLSLLFGMYNILTLLWTLVVNTTYIIFGYVVGKQREDSIKVILRTLSTLGKDMYAVVLVFAVVLIWFYFRARRLRQIQIEKERKYM